MRVPKALITEWVDYCIPMLVDRMDFNPSLAFFAVAGQCEVHSDVLISDDWFAYEHKTGKLSLASGPAPIVRKLAGCTKEKITSTEAVRPV